jgi:uncharacterized membrane protein
MNANDISLLGWTHTLLCALALISGAVQLARSKGTYAHALCGNVYFLSMAIANVMALFIFHGDLLIRSGQPGVHVGQGFGVVHWLAVITLVALLLGRIAASHQRVAFFAYIVHFTNDALILAAIVIAVVQVRQFRRQLHEGAGA